MYCSIVFAIASASSSEYSWSESRLKSVDLNSSRLRVLKCLLDDQNCHSDDRYAVSNRGGYAVLISWNEYAVLDKELDTPYLMEVDTPYSAKLKTLDALPSLLNKVTNALNRFTQAIASKKTEDASVPSVGPVITQLAEGEKNTNQTTISYSSQPNGEHIKKDNGRKAMYSEVVEKESTNSDSDDDDETHLTSFMVDSSKIKKGPITLKVYREDGTSEVIPNFKVSDLHLDEWREVMNACPNRTGKRWKIIYDQIRSIMDYVHSTKAELGINLDIPLSK
ncbi:hypothetical protein Tco_0139327 [Tanacetum coccineum]